MKRLSLPVLIVAVVILLAGQGLVGNAHSSRADSEQWQVTSPLVEGRVFQETFVAQGSGGTAYVYATGGQQSSG